MQHFFKHLQQSSHQRLFTMSSEKVEEGKTRLVRQTSPLFPNTSMLELSMNMRMLLSLRCTGAVATSLK